MTPSAPGLASRSLPLTLAVFAAIAGLAGCASVPKVADVVYPPPPEKPRIKLVGFVQGRETMNRSGWRVFMDALMPRDPRAFVTEPSGLALSPDEKILYVVSAPKARMVRADLENGIIEVFAATPGGSPPRPYAAATDKDGLVYVTDRGTNEIWVIAPNGTTLRRFGKEKLQVPGSIAIDRERQVAYVIAGATRETDHRVEVFALDGRHLRTIGKRGGGPGEFNFPSSLAVGPGGNLYVADMLNFRIQIFDPEGQLQTFFGEPGVGRIGAFEKPKGIAFDTFGNVYVVDAIRNVQILNSRWDPLLSFGEGVIRAANPILISSKNEIFIGDYGLGAVTRFQLVNTTAADSVDAPPPSADRATDAPAGSAGAAPATPSTLPAPPPPAR